MHGVHCMRVCTRPSAMRNSHPGWNRRSERTCPQPFTPNPSRRRQMHLGHAARMGRHSGQVGHAVHMGWYSEQVGHVKAGRRQAGSADTGGGTCRESQVRWQASAFDALWDNTKGGLNPASALSAVGWPSQWHCRIPARSASTQRRSPWKTAEAQLRCSTPTQHRQAKGATQMEPLGGCTCVVNEGCTRATHTNTQTHTLPCTRAHTNMYTHKHKHTQTDLGGSASSGKTS